MWGYRLVAILLSRFKMTTTDAIAAYYDFSGRIFSKKNRKGIMGVLVGHPFREKPLVDIIKGMVATHQIGELMIDPKPEARSKAFVCSQPAHRQGKATRFRTYEPPPPLKINTSPEVSSPSGSSSSTSLHSSSSKSASQSSASSADDSLALGLPELKRITSTMKDPWNDYRDVQIWEAARATTAAPSYFDPMVLTRGNNSRTFIDGAMGCNNPAKEVVDEAAALFGTDCVLGCLVSLGTGFSGEVTIGEAESGIKKTVGLINNLKKIATNTEEVHEDLRRLIRADLDTYFRFQLPKGAEEIRLHEYKKLDELSQLMQVYIEKESSEIDKVVQILIDKAKPRGITLGQIGKHSVTYYSWLHGIKLTASNQKLNPTTARLIRLRKISVADHPSAISSPVDKILLVRLPRTFAQINCVRIASGIISYMVNLVSASRRLPLNF